MVTLDRSGPLFETGSLKSDLNILEQSFTNLPPDPYVEEDENLRARRYSRYKFDGKTITRLPPKEFVQSSDINDYLGDVERTYEEIEDHLLSNDAFKDMFLALQNHTGIDHDRIIEAHQIRWNCTHNKKAPAPEGRHQDGFDFIALYIVGDKGIKGGETMLFKNENDSAFFKEHLKPGEYVVLNDRLLWHNAADIEPETPGITGHWDVFVLTT